MPSVQVTIASHTYRMACGEGDEARLEKLAAALDRRIAEMSGSFGEIGDLRLHVMAALQLVDELGEAERRTKALETENAALREEARRTAMRNEAGEREVVDALADTAARIERIALGLAGPGSGGGH